METRGHILKWKIVFVYNGRFTVPPLSHEGNHQNCQMGVGDYSPVSNAS